MRNIQDIIPNEDKLLYNKLEENSQKIEKNDIFIALKGINTDSSKYVEDAINKGAIAVISYELVTTKVKNFIINDISEIYQKYYNNSFKKIKKIGITGTDGKTTTSTYLYQMINSFSSCGYLGTNGYQSQKRFQETMHTTPVLKEMYRFLNDMVEDHCEYAAFEVSSHALSMGRTSGLEIDVVGISNIKVDHLDYHKTLENYINAKKLLFENNENSIKVLNIDDEIISKFKYSNVVTYGINNDADIQALSIIYDEQYTMYDLKIFENIYHVKVKTLALFNVYNVLLAVGVLKGFGINDQLIVKSLNYISSVKGRMNFIDEGQNFVCLVDFAHTINAVKEIFNFAKSKKYDKIYTVTGAAGNRDISKRPIIGKFVLENSTKVYLTTDDPASEDPYKICLEMLKTTDLKNYEIIVDRKEAINQVIKNAPPNSIVLIIGKGADDFMEVNGEYLEYDEIKTVQEALRRLNE